MLRDDLLNQLNKHRQQEVITCEQGCICWDLERIIYEFDQDQQGDLTTGAVDDATRRDFEREHLHPYGFERDCELCNPHRN